MRPKCGRVGRWPRIRRGQGRGSRRRRTPARGGHGHRTRPATPRRSRPAPPGRTAGWSAARSCRHGSLGACVEGAVRRVRITLSGHWGRLRLPQQAARAAGPPGSPTGRSINCAKRTTSPVTIGPLGPPGSGPPARGPQRVSTARVHNAEPLLRPRSSRSSQTSWLLSRRWRRPDTGRRRMAFQVRLTRPISTIAVATRPPGGCGAVGSGLASMCPGSFDSMGQQTKGVRRQ